MSEITLYDESSQAHVRITLVSAGTVDGKGNLSWLDKSFVFFLELTIIYGEFNNLVDFSTKGQFVVTILHVTVC